MSPFPKTCGCGREYTEAEWKRLRLVGYFGGSDAEGKWCVEMKNCPGCFSTLAVDCVPLNPRDEADNAHP